MTAQVKVNLRGLNQLMRSEPVQAIVDAEGRRIAAAAGPDFEYKPLPHRWMARGFVQPANARGAREQARNAVLERAIS
ncbi:hypothetical protein [Microbacterium allomyrinae]|uniref:Uncharacterized protein n=1 Tax=Microbacterium allomyrinae TaxID=2830666 RepID=A0A9X1S3D4_9MICO|nr:hypothetical protein [Microbacterium allomyrinae]MCC2031828.1 hypothetical protein [Microbacterium allomyrinae]